MSIKAVLLAVLFGFSLFTNHPKIKAVDYKTWVAYAIGSVGLCASVANLCRLVAKSKIDKKNISKKEQIFVVTVLLSSLIVLGIGIKDLQSIQYKKFRGFRY